MQIRGFISVGLACGVGLISACQGLGGVLGAIGPGRLPNSALDSGGAKGGSATATHNPQGGSASPGAGADALGARRVEGHLRSPDSRLVANNSAALIDLGGGAFYRLQAAQPLGQKPLAGARVSLVDAAGKPLGADSAVSDATGAYSLPAPPDGTQAFVRAEFSADGKDFEFESALVLTASGDARVDVDAASTLVAGKLKSLLGKGLMSADKLTREKLDGLTDKILGALQAGNIPFMAKGSRDILAAFDQLVLDLPDIAGAATALDADAVAQTGQWQVSTLLSQADLVSRGVLPAGGPPLSAAGNYEVDPDGGLFLPALGTSTVPIVIYRMVAGGQPEAYARLPFGIHNPVLLAISPGGLLYAAGVDPEADEVRIFSGAGDMRPIAALPTTMEPAVFANQSRLAVEADGAIVLARPDLGTISRIPPPATVQSAGSRQAAVTSAQPTITPPQAGGGLWASYRYYIPTPPPIPSIPPIPTFPPIPSPPPFPGLDELGDFSFPADFALSGSGQLLMANLEDAVIRTVGKGGGKILAGKVGQKGYRNGRGGQALFGKPRAIVSDPEGNVFVVDSEARRVRRLSPDGSVFLVAGSGADGLADGAGPAASFHDPRSLRSDGKGNLYVIDYEPVAGSQPQERIRKIARSAD